MGSDSEVGTLRVVILHRPGAEWQSEGTRAEHDAFAAVLRSRGVEVLLLGDLLAQALVSGAARMHGISAAVNPRRLGVPLAQQLSAYLRTLDPAALAHVLIAGMTFADLPFAASEVSLVRSMHHGADFVIDPLPSLVSTRDSSFWIGPRVAITSLSLPARARETSLTDVISAHHPRFLGVRRAYESRSAPVEGGDVLLLAPGVIAVGVGERTPPAGAEALALSLFDDDLAHAVLAVPIARGAHLDSVCAIVDVDAVVMNAGPLSAFTIRRSSGGVRIDDEQPFVHAAASAIGIDRLRVIDTGADRDGTNTLALAPGVVVAYDRNSETNARLQDSGIEVLTIGASEPGVDRGGPRGMSCPATRDPL